MVDPNRVLFESVVRLLAPVLDELVFVGGCTTGLFITDPAASGIRPTKDVDAIVDVTSYAKYTALSERLRRWDSSRTPRPARRSAGGDVTISSSTSCVGLDGMRRGNCLARCERLAHCEHGRSRLLTRDVRSPSNARSANARGVNVNNKSRAIAI